MKLTHKMIAGITQAEMVFKILDVLETPFFAENLQAKGLSGSIIPANVVDITFIIQTRFGIYDKLVFIS